MKKVSLFVLRISNGPLVLALLFVYISFPLHFMKEAGETIAAYTGTALPLDLRLSYTQEEVSYFFQMLGSSGMDYYSFVAKVLDPVYMIVFTAFYIFTIGYFLKKLQVRSQWRYLLLLPFLTLFLDVSENICIVTMLSAYPGDFSSVVPVSATCSFSKWMIFYLQNIIAISLLLIVSFKKLKAGKRNKASRIAIQRQRMVVKKERREVKRKAEPVKEDV